MHLIIIDFVIFTILYVVVFKLLNPSQLYSDLISEEYVKKGVKLSDKKLSEIKNRFDDLNALKPDWVDKLKESLKPCTWYALLKKFNDDNVKATCGSDGALYIIFLRYSAIFFTLLSMGNVGLVYLYVSGRPENSK